MKNYVVLTHDAKLRCLTKLEHRHYLIAAYVSRFSPWTTNNESFLSWRQSNLSTNLQSSLAKASKCTRGTMTNAMFKQAPQIACFAFKLFWTCVRYAWSSEDWKPRNSEVREQAVLGPNQRYRTLSAWITSFVFCNSLKNHCSHMQNTFDYVFLRAKPSVAYTLPCYYTACNMNLSNNRVPDTCPDIKPQR
jgi:hypothetical protein